MSQPAHVECCPDAIGKGCWVSDLCGNAGYRFYTGVVVGIFKNPLDGGKYYQVRTRNGIENLHPSLIIVHED